MMIIITKQDLTRMSPELRNELIQLMFKPEQEWNAQLPETDMDFEDFQSTLSMSPFPEFSGVIQAQEDEVFNSKTVIEIDEEQANALLSNLSSKSIETLKLFVSDKPVDISSLVGEECPYKSFVELKRSFVGPVNRRLRTVTRNRTAVLFRKVGEDENEVKIAVKVGTAKALKLGLKL